MKRISAKLALRIRANGLPLPLESNYVSYEDGRVKEIASEQSSLLTRLAVLDYEVSMLASERVLFFEPSGNGFHAMLRTERGGSLGRHTGVLRSGRVMTKDGCRKYAEMYATHSGLGLYIDYSGLGD